MLSVATNKIIYNIYARSEMSERPQENKRERKGSNDGVGGTLNSSFKHCSQRLFFPDLVEK